MAIVLVVLLLAVVVGGAAFYAWAQRPLTVAIPKDFVLQPGSLKSVAGQLEAQQVIDQPELFVLLARLTGQAGSLKAGSYHLSLAPSPLELLEKIGKGDTSMVRVALVEGRNWRELRRQLEGNRELKSDIRGMSDAEIAKALAIDAPSLEGQFFPDTYQVDKGSSTLELLRRAHVLLQEKLDAAWGARAPGLPLKSAQEALILASLIEKETGKAEDRPLIAGVFINRLKTGMRLQTDPSVIYGVGEAFDGDLKKIHLQTDTPWNTYTRGGLPPTPIAMVGDAALLAATQPAQTKAFYFVARGDGSSEFSATLDEHNAAVRKYILKQ
ncbi:endolytic transglycosylase MltG [Chitinilyticum piscinae]|uniref:Endolytic murein transglycosylase n=1 Tax=Chitinilyticum piscinae TaxID=2866724 RepID=A0A8J7G1Z5_9NEIS|nr:endolytic transglycosylase MltG [Chitinilyticum piscinae]MBE9609908.1 endolytic transglycosylase MltG [Chitinilyticum piscinae]